MLDPSEAVDERDQASSKCGFITLFGRTLTLNGQLRLKEVFFPVALVLIIFFSTLVVPALGVVMGLVSPAPLIFVYLQKGRQVGSIAIGVVLLMILLLMGTRPMFIFCAEYVVLTVTMSESVRLRVPIANCVLLSALGSAIASGLLLMQIFASREISLAETFQREISENLAQSMAALKGMGKSQAELDSMKGLVDKIAQTFAVFYPAFLAVGSLFCASVNFSIVRFLLTRVNRIAPDFMEGFSGWVLPEHLVWAFIVSGGAFFLSESGLRVLGLNVFIVMVAIYFLQGLAIVVYTLEKKAVPGILWFLVMTLIITQPLVMGVVSGFGLFDLWVDFRKLKPVPDDNDTDINDGEE